MRRLPTLHPPLSCPGSLGHLHFSGLPNPLNFQISRCSGSWSRPVPTPLASPSPLLGSSFWLQPHTTLGRLKWLPAFSLEGRSHSASPVTKLAVTHLLRLSSVISSSRRFRRLLQAESGPSIGFPESLVLGSNQRPYLAGLFLCPDLRLPKTVTDSLVLP